MGVIFLKGASAKGATLLSNRFIDEYMPAANGDFVKVFIFLQRSLSEGKGELSTSAIADRFLCTEGDVLRALRYWESKGLLSLSFGEDGQLSAIHFGEEDCGQASLSAEDIAEPAFSGRGELVPQALPEENAEQPAQAIITPITVARKACLTPDRIRELKESEDVTSLLFVAEQYLGKSLTLNETEKILYLYDEMHMSVDLIDYLVEMCVSRGHKSIYYIESVARSWAKDGITTVEMARAASTRYKKDYYTILRAMGISNRNPVAAEVKMMDTWLDAYGFSMDIILEACSRTVIQTGQGSFPYADKILTDWHSQNVRHLSDVQVLDERHGQKTREARTLRATKPTGTTGTGASSGAANRFNNFSQREYNFEEYERKLLNQ